MEYLTEIGFSSRDILLLWSCPLAGVIGGFAHAIILYLDFTNMKRPDGFNTNPLNPQSIFELIWLGYRLILGAITGLVLSLYFLGALDSQPSTVARIWGLAIALGYIAPKLWIKQDIVFERLVENRIRELTGDSQNNNRLQNGNQI